MPEPLAICLENLDPGKSGHRYTRCTALVGRSPGLRIGACGQIRWEKDRDTACEIWVSQDDRLILYRPCGAVPVTVRRGGRSLDVPTDKPVVVLDQDRFEVGRSEFCIHVHGIAPQVSAPSPLKPQARQAAAGVAAAVALSAALVGCCGGDVEVREIPPSIAIPEEPADDDSAEPAAAVTEEPTEKPAEPTGEDPTPIE